MRGTESPTGPRLTTMTVPGRSVPLCWRNSSFSRRASVSKKYCTCACTFLVAQQLYIPLCLLFCLFVFLFECPCS